MRRKLQSQGNGRVKTRKNDIDLHNNQGGWQIGLVSNGLGEVALNEFKNGNEEPSHPL